MRKSVEDLIASSTAIDNNLNQVLAKVSPSLLRRRSPSPAANNNNNNNNTAAAQQRESLGSSGGNTSSSSGRKSDNYLSPPPTTHPDGGGGGLSEHDGSNSSKAKSSSSDGSSHHSSSPSDTSQMVQQGKDGGGGALSKSPSTGSMSSKTKNKVPNQAKKKSWYSVFYPSYKSRSADFKKLFKDVPDDERLLVDYSSALQRDILVHGRLYLSQNYLCFYSNIFGWETCLTIKLKDVTSVTKEKTALVIPNAILISTEADKHFFTSFTARDNAYLMLFRVWQNALMDKSMQPPELWQWIHYVYGDELGLTSEDEDYIDPYDDLPLNKKGKPNKSLVHKKMHAAAHSTATDSVSEEQSNPESSDNTGGSGGGGSRRSVNHNLSDNDKRQSPAEASGGSGQNTGDGGQLPQKASGAETVTTKADSAGAGGSKSGRNSDLEGGASSRDRSKDSSAMGVSGKTVAGGGGGAGTGGGGRKALASTSSRSGAAGTTAAGGASGSGGRQLEEQTLATDMSDTSDSEQDNNLDLIGQAECTSNHEGRQMIHTILPINVDILFALLFSKSKFLENFHANRKTTDLVCGEWMLEAGKKLRTVKLTVALTQPVGPKCSQVTEKQTLRDCSVPGQLYSVDIISTNAGIPYAESFFVTMHYCLVRTVDDHTMFSVHTQIQYKKSVWGVVKGFIEKNTWNGLEDFYTALVRALQTEYNIPPAKAKSRRARRGTTAPKPPVEVFDPTISRMVKTKSATLPRMSSIPIVGPASAPEVVTKVQYKSMSLFVILLLLLLIGLNAFLYVKLWELESLEAHKMQYPDFTKMSPIYSKILRDPPKSHDDWIRIMQEQERLHNAEMGKWQSVLQIAVDLLRKVNVVCKKIVKNAKVDELDLIGDNEDEDDESLFSVADDLLRHKEL